MACGVTGAGAAAGSVAGGAEAAGVCAIPVVVINPAPRAETRIRVRFIRLWYSFERSLQLKLICLRQHCLCDSSGTRGLHASTSLLPEKLRRQSMQFYYLGGAGFG